MAPISIRVNGQAKTVDVDPQTPLLWVLRDVLQMTGTKYGCGIEVCGACTVWIDGSPEKSCHIPVQEVTQVNVTTIEGLSADPQGAKCQQAWIDGQVPQCGFCQPGMLMRAAKFVKGNSNPTDAQVASGVNNICVCGTYPRVNAAVKKAAAR